MKFLLAGALLIACGTSGLRAEKMTYEQALARIPDRPARAFWVGDVADLPARWQTLKRGKTRVFAHSPGGRALYLVSYGTREPQPRRANFNSAIGARRPAAYCDRAARRKPVILFVGPVHGHEVEGLTGLVNLIHVMETGRDLRGREQAALRQLGRRCRLLIIPAGNPDGVARFAPRRLTGMRVEDLRFWGQGTRSDGTLRDWPEVKQQHPMVGDTVGFLGCYFNDAGVNPMHDEFFAPMSPEAPGILAIARAEAPDLIVSLHSHENRPALLRPAYVPLETQEDARQLAEETYALLAKRGLPHATPFRARAESGPRPASFNLVSALHHTCGATVFTFECPHGLVGPHACRVTPGQILDIELTLYEAMMRHALRRHAALRAAAAAAGKR
jgi:hypothetical protein